MAYCKLMKYFKAMDKKAKFSSGLITKVYDKLPETRTFIDEEYSE